ncbi:TIGR00282 family metallophosphoesterase [Patescibacteria group bacterium]|nr:TIGR00282 family metallophosphoesterase [Patescibacteria group bacterium]
MKILFFGDIFGRPGREVLRHMLPQWKKEYKPDVIIANGENASHGAGISENAIKEMLGAGVDIVTGGNHSIEGKNADVLLNDAKLPLLRPANMSSACAGKGHRYFTFGNKEILVINLIGQVHMRFHYDSPFLALDNILEENKSGKNANIILVDWHAEASSEKVALAWHVDGRVSAVLGTHSHTPTADARILPQGTGLISDVGFLGPHNSIIGQEISQNLKRFLTQTPIKVDVAQAPPYEINAVFLEIDNASGKTIKIEQVRKIIQEDLKK